MRTVKAELLHENNGMWTFWPHTLSEVAPAWCGAVEGRWKLRSQYLSGGGTYHDAWSRTSGSDANDRPVR
jgi:hypothetical protein